MEGKNHDHDIDQNQILLKRKWLTDRVVRQNTHRKKKVKKTLRTIETPRKTWFKIKMAKHAACQNCGTTDFFMITLNFRTWKTDLFHVKLIVEVSRSHSRNAFLKRLGNHFIKCVWEKKPENAFREVVNTRKFCGKKWHISRAQYFSGALRNTRKILLGLYGSVFGPEKISGLLRNARQERYIVILLFYTVCNLQVLKWPAYFLSRPF